MILLILKAEKVERRGEERHRERFSLHWFSPDLARLQVGVWNSIWVDRVGVRNSPVWDITSCSPECALWGLTGVETLVFIVGILGSIETVMTARPKIGGLSQADGLPWCGYHPVLSGPLTPFLASSILLLPDGDLVLRLNYFTCFLESPLSTRQITEFFNLCD